MLDPIALGKIVRIRDLGLNEVWLQEQILANPSSLQLGDLEVVNREKAQPAGGRLDILLKDPEDDSMYEVEVMLGETDETHIVRTIEYWTKEKRIWPLRQHYPVMVAESITRRFFDVIQVLSHAIPIIAIQATIIEANGQRILSFSKILDAYEEPEDTEPAYEPHDEPYWVEKAAWTNEAARLLFDIVSSVLGESQLRYGKNHISLSVNGKSYFWFNQRAAPRSSLSFWVGDRLIAEGQAMLEEKGIGHVVKKNETIRIKGDKSLIADNADLFKNLARLVKRAWTE